MKKHTNNYFIVSGLVLSIIIFIGFSILIITYIYPKVKIYEEEKLKSIQLMNDLDTLKQKGISFNDFKTISSNSKNNAYLNNILKEVDLKFYNENFINNSGNIDLNTFYKNKLNEINTFIKSEKYTKNENIYKKLLPTYVDVENKNDIGTMTDLKFVSFIENLTRDFNLTSDNTSINLGDLKILEDYNDEKAGGSIESTIYYIPYKFDLSGKPEKIIDFIYYLENVASIKILDDLSISIVENKYIKNDKTEAGVNIMESPLIDIESINFSDYLSTGKTGNFTTEQFIDEVKKNLGDGKIKVNIDSRIYVKGLPKNKIEEYIIQTKDKFKKLKDNYTKELATIGDKIGTKSKKVKLEKVIIYLNELEPVINQLNANGDTAKIYSKVVELNKYLDLIDKK